MPGATGVQVGALLVSNGRVLMCLRRADRAYYPGVWDVPGGHVEMGETPAEALKRELWEELGIVVDLPMTGVAARLAEPRSGLDLHLWTVRTWLGTPTNHCPAEHERIDWFAADDVDGLTLADDRYRSLIRAALAPTLSPD